ncbi:copper homeostasis protein CutC [Flavobacterium marginilacus]|uniref:copper homeostasis protein CutC n=1 Tax=Flavobacterium marginilacus TaxID=3003256 RepID=UPI00248F16D5|nr:copper homeostasis protein CutC [Flavobacterium marginilacus]
MKNSLLEIACFNLQSAVIAQQNGADRIELCANMKEGGTTPDFETARKVRSELHIMMYVMIRPRGGNFVYTNEEFSKMKNDIEQFKSIGADGFVFGILNNDGTVNVEQNKQLVALASPFPCTFHRAFDVVPSVYDSLEIVINCGFKTILTSGQAANVLEGIEVLSVLAEKARNRIVIMPGGGFRSLNSKMIMRKTNALFYHSSAITDSGETADADEIKALKQSLH